MSRPDRPKTDAIIVGVVGDVKHSTMRLPALPTCYTLYLQAEHQSGLTVYVRTWSTPQLAQNSIRAAMADIDSKLILNRVATLTEKIDESLLASAPLRCWPPHSAWSPRCLRASDSTGSSPIPQRSAPARSDSHGAGRKARSRCGTHPARDAGCWRESP